MKIMHELNQLDYGGAERVVLGIATNDKQNEHMIFAYKDGPMRKVFEDAGIKVVVEKEDQDTPELQIDIMHLHTGGAPSPLAHDTKGVIATIETVHSPVASAVRDEWIHARVGVTDVVTKLNRKCRTIHNGVGLSRLELKTVDGDGHEKFEDPKKWCKSLFGIPEDAFVVGRLGRLGYDKCIEDWLAAAWYFQKDHPQKDKIWFIIAGNEAEPNYWATIKVMCASLPLKNVVFVEDPGENVAPVYAAMDVFMYGSPTEGFGLVYLEAAACGAAVLAWENPVTRELLTGHARLVPQTVDGLVDGLRFMFDNPDIREQLAELGQDLATLDMTEARMAEGYQKLYAEVYRSVYNMEPKELVES